MQRLSELGRMKQIVICIIIIILFAVIKFSGINHEYRSPEEVLYACEKGLHYGPSEEILYKKKIGGKVLVIGRTEGGLSSVPAKRNWYGAWALLSGAVVDGNLKVDENGAFYDHEFNFLYGLCKNSDIKSVKITLGSLDSINGRTEYGTYDIKVNNNGFFYTDIPPIQSKVEGDYVFPMNIEGFDEAGYLIYSYDEFEK